MIPYNSIVITQLEFQLYLCIFTYPKSLYSENGLKHHSDVMIDAGVVGRTFLIILCACTHNGVYPCSCILCTFYMSVHNNGLDHADLANCKINKENFLLSRYTYFM